MTEKSKREKLNENPLAKITYLRFRSNLHLLLQQRVGLAPRQKRTRFRTRTRTRTGTPAPAPAITTFPLRLRRTRHNPTGFSEIPKTQPDSCGPDLQIRNPVGSSTRKTPPRRAGTVVSGNLEAQRMHSSSFPSFSFEKSGQILSGKLL